MHASLLPDFDRSLADHRIPAADNPYDYRYGSAAYERAMAGRRSDERLNAPVTNSGGYTPDMSAAVAQIRQTLGPKLTPQEIMLNRRREQEEARRAREEPAWRPNPELLAQIKPEPAEPSYAQRLRTLADQGDSQAMFTLGRLELYAPDATARARGLQRLETSANRGNEKSAELLISHYLQHPELNQFNRVIELMADLADRGNAHYTRELAQAYLDGIPGKLAPDPAKALKFLQEGFTRWADGTCGLALARAYRDGKPFPQDTAKAIATYRQLIDAQSKRQDTMNPPRYNTGAAGWEWFQLVQQRDSGLRNVDPATLALWEYAALHGEPHTRAATHRLAAELGRIYNADTSGPRQPLKAVLFFSIATSGDHRSARPADTDEVVLSAPEQARMLYTLGNLLRETSPAWPQIDRGNQLVRAMPIDVARLYTRACAYAGQPDAQGVYHAFPGPFIALHRLSYFENYGLKLDDEARLALLDKALDLGDVPNDPNHPDYQDYAETLYERARHLRALGDSMPDTQARAALAFQKAWDYGYLPAGLPLAELIDDLRLPGKTREDAKAVCRAAAQRGDPFAAAQLGTWLTGEIVALQKPAPAVVAEARQLLAQATAAKIDHASEDAAVLAAATGDFAQSAALFQYVLKAAPSPRAKAGFAELLATGKGGLPADRPDALKLLEEASDEDALYTIRYAEVFQFGQWGEKRDMDKAVELLERALLRDNEWRAGIVLARLYHTGDGVAKDEEKAYEYLQAAGDRGNNETARVIAAGYETGDIINADLESAAHWRNIAIHGRVLDPG